MYTTSKVFKQGKQLIWNVDTAAIFSQMNKTLKFTIPWYLQHNRRQVKVFTKSFREKSFSPVICWATGKEKPARFLKTVILCEAFRGSFKRKLGSSLCYHRISAHACFCIWICLIFRFAHLAYYCFCAMLFSVSHLGRVNIFCCLYYMPCIYLNSPLLCWRCVYCLLFSKTR